MTCTTTPEPVRTTRRAPRSRPARRRAPLVVVAFAALAVLASACHQDNTPQFYNSVTKNNFTQGCIGGSTGTTLAPQDLCECMYTVTTGMIPASGADEKARDHGKTFATYTGQTFIQINNELKTNPNKVPASLQDAWAKTCNDQGYTGSTTTTAKPSSGGGPTTTKG
jgi:hypothetical protein